MSHACFITSWYKQIEMWFWLLIRNALHFAVDSILRIRIAFTLVDETKSIYQRTHGLLFFQAILAKISKLKSTRAPKLSIIQNYSRCPQNSGTKAQGIFFFEIFTLEEASTTVSPKL